MSEQPQPSNTTENNAKKPGGVTGKGFVKGDPRINRKGRPKSFDALRSLAQQIASEAAKIKGEPVIIDGHVATNVELVLREMMQGKQRQQFLEIAYGKVPQPVEMSGPGGGPIEVQATDYRAAIAPLAPRSVDDSDSSGQD